jgi:hypothetical protein
MSFIALGTTTTMEQALTVIAHANQAGIPSDEIALLDVCADRSDALRPCARVVHSADQVTTRNLGTGTVTARTRDSHTIGTDPGPVATGRTQAGIIRWQIPAVPAGMSDMALDLYELGVSWFEAHRLAAELRVNDLLILVDVGSRTLCEEVVEIFREAGCDRISCTASWHDCPNHDQGPERDDRQSSGTGNWTHLAVSFTRPDQRPDGRG